MTGGERFHHVFKRLLFSHVLNGFIFSSTFLQLCVGPIVDGYSGRLIITYRPTHGMYTVQYSHKIYKLNGDDANLTSFQTLHSNGECTLHYSAYCCSRCRPPQSGNTEVAGLDITRLDNDGRMCGQLTELKLQNFIP